MSLVHDTARMLAMGLPAGGTLPNTVCPVCQGGRTHEPSFSVSRLRDGRIAFNCYRASCSVNGGYCDDSGYSDAIPSSKQVQTRKLTPYEGSIHKCTQADEHYFMERFGLNRASIRSHIRVGDGDDYLLPIRARLGQIVGYVRRQPAWKGTPEPVRKGRGYGPKAKTLLHEDAEPIAFYRAQDPKFGLRDTVIVEDQLSAMRASQLVDVNAVALLGTTLNMARVRDIARFSGGHVIIALDEDATGAAFRLAQAWGLAFKSCRVAILPCDLKDMDDEFEMLHALGIT